MTSNYFKVSTTAFDPAKKGLVTVSSYKFFDDRRPESIRQAHSDAVATVDMLAKGQRGNGLAVFKKPKVCGPWDDVPVVGEFPIGENDLDIEAEG